MSRLAVIGGNSILGTDLGTDGTPTEVVVEGAAEPVTLLDCGGFVLFQRHGASVYRAAPALDHRAHLRALQLASVDRILGLASVGSLVPERLPVGAALAPDDFIALHLGVSFSTGAGAAQVPGFDPQWRAAVLDAWPHDLLALHDGGVYWQVIGPRFETPAEVRLIANYADVVGMTIASEAILARELDIPYAAVCMVDNLANGLAPRPLTIAEFEAGKRANQAVLLRALAAVLPVLSEPSP